MLKSHKPAQNINLNDLMDFEVEMSIVDNKKRVVQPYQEFFHLSFIAELASTT